MIRQEKQGLSCSAESEKHRVQQRRQVATTTPNLDLVLPATDLAQWSAPPRG